MKDSLRLLSSVDNKAENKAIQQGLPPVDSWNPPCCGDSGICIGRDGTWFHQGSPFVREKLVKMFSRIIRLDDDGKYYLVTPVEKMLLTVEDVPFIAVGFEIVEDARGSNIIFETNVGDKVVVDDTHPFTVHMVNGEPAPYILIRKNLKARVARSVYYQLIDVALEVTQGEETLMVIESNGEQYELGRF